jgi:hypothetical protein
MKKRLFPAIVLVLFLTSYSQAENDFFGLLPFDSLPQLEFPNLIGDFDFTASAYVWGFGLTGTMGFGRKTGTLDVGFSNIPKNLGGGLIGSLEVGNGQFFVISDIAYAKVSPSVDSTILDVALTLKFFSADLAAGYRLAHSLGSIDLFAGARYISMDTKLELDLRRAIASEIDKTVLQLPPEIRSDVMKLYPSILTSTPLSEMLSQTIQLSPGWVDPFIGGRAFLELGRGARLVFRGEAGGLVAVMWHVIAGIDFKLGNYVSAALVYRHLGYDFKQEGGLVFHAGMTGPAIAFQITF